MIPDITKIDFVISLAKTYMDRIGVRDDLSIGEQDIFVVCQTLTELYEQNSLLEEKVKELEKKEDSIGLTEYWNKDTGEYSQFVSLAEYVRPQEKVKELEKENEDLKDSIEGLESLLEVKEKEIEDATSVWGYIGTHASTWSTHPPGTFIQEFITHKAKLIRLEKI